MLEQLHLLRQRGIFWDFHGVLEKDNELAVQSVMNAVLATFGYDKQVSVDFVLAMYGYHWKDLYKKVVSDAGDEALNSMVEESERIGVEHARRHIKPREGSHETLYLLAKKGYYNVLLSNTTPERLEQFVDSVGLGGLFTEIIGVENHTNIVDYKCSKIEDFCQRKQLSRKIVVDDSHLGIEVGKRVSATIVHFLSHDLEKHPDAQYGIKNLKELLLIL